MTGPIEYRVTLRAPIPVVRPGDLVWADHVVAQLLGKQQIGRSVVLAAEDVERVLAEDWPAQRDEFWSEGAIQFFNEISYLEDTYCLEGRYRPDGRWVQLEQGVRGAEPSRAEAPARRGGRPSNPAEVERRRAQAEALRAEGKSNKQIALHLGVSLRTVQRDWEKNAKK